MTRIQVSTGFMLILAGIAAAAGCGSVGGNPALTGAGGASVSPSDGGGPDAVTSDAGGATGTGGATVPGTGGRSGAGAGGSASVPDASPVDVAADAPLAHCLNQTRDADETDVDCGGPACGPCTEGKLCLVGRDCVAGNQCAAGRCTSKAPPLDPALIGYWPFDTGPADVSAQKNDAKVFNATTAVGKVGNGYQVTGNGCLVVPHSASLAMAGGNTLTFMAWVNYAGACPDTDQDRGIIFNFENSYESGIQCGAVPAFQEAIQPLGGAVWAWMGTKVITVNAWQHVAVVWDGATVVHYVNGSPFDTRALVGALSDKATGLGIGCRTVPADGSSAGVGAFFEGTIDEAAIYRRALSAAEILAYYNATK
jgi:hypothetical protein